MKKSHAKAQVTERRKETKTAGRYKDLCRQHLQATAKLEIAKDVLKKMMDERDMTLKYIASLEKQLKKYKTKQGLVITPPGVDDGKITKGGIIVPEGADVGADPISE